MRFAFVLLAACGSSPPPVGNGAPQTFVYRRVDLHGIVLATVTLALDNAKVTYAARTNGREATIAGTAKRADDALVLDFAPPGGGPHVGLTCIDKPFVIAPAMATVAADGCATPTWNEATEQITLLECRERPSGDVGGGARIAIVAPAPGVEEVMVERTGCPPLDPEARPLLRRASPVAPDPT